MTRQAIPYQFEKTHAIRELRRLHATLAPGSRARGTVRIAGRVLRRRDHGALTFIDLADETGTIQLWIDGQAADAQGLTSYPSGTWIGIEGEAAVTRRGELSVRVRTWTLLALCDRRVPDRRYAPTDPDAQMRERYADLWARPEARDVLRRRFEMTAMLRADLARRGYLEVETPILHDVKGGALARPFKTHHNALDTELTLRIAPELDLKRLVVAGFERVFEIGRVFRNEGLSPRHNPEFTSLEVYAAYADYSDMMSLTEGLVSTVATMLNGAPHAFVHDQRIDLTPPWPRATIHGLVGTLLGEEITSATPVDRLRLHADRLGVHVPVDAGAGRVVAEIYEQRIERTLTGPIFVCDYPREVSPLARRHRNDPLLAERFEVVVAGMELANAYSELQDADDQEAQLLQQAAQHAAGDDEAMSHDEEYVRALRFGLPPTGGLGIGIDRLAMLLTNSDSIRDVLAFPTLRPAAAQVIDNRNGGAARAATRTAPARTTPEPVTPVTTSTRRSSP